MFLCNNIWREMKEKCFGENYDKNYFYGIFGLEFDNGFILEESDVKSKFVVCFLWLVGIELLTDKEMEQFPKRLVRKTIFFKTLRAMHFQFRISNLNFTVNSLHRKSLWRRLKSSSSNVSTCLSKPCCVLPRV